MFTIGNWILFGIVALVEGITTALAYREYKWKFPTISTIIIAFAVILLLMFGVAVYNQYILLK